MATQYSLYEANDVFARYSVYTDSEENYRALRHDADVVMHNVSSQPHEELLRLSDDCLRIMTKDPLPTVDVFQCFSDIYMMANYALIYTCYDVEALRKFFCFCRDDLFLLYLKDRQCYAGAAFGYYAAFIGENPDISKYGYNDIDDIVQGRPGNNSHQDIDYIQVAGLCAALADKFTEIGYTVPEIERYDEIQAIYYKFRDVADLDSGALSSNLPKANKIYRQCLKKPPHYNKSDPFDGRPVWIAMAYAVAEATGQYYQRAIIAKKFGLEDCIEPTTREQRNIAQVKSAKKKRLIGALAILAVGILVVIISQTHPLWIVVPLVFALFVILAMNDPLAGTPYGTYYIGHHYIGPAWWFYYW